MHLSVLAHPVINSFLVHYTFVAIKFYKEPQVQQRQTKQSLVHNDNAFYDSLLLSLS